MIGDSPVDHALAEQIAQLAKALACPRPSEETLRRLVRYQRAVEQWGARIDLTAPKSARELLDLSFADALIVAREEVSRGAMEDVVCDVGSGGGAPGIPLLLLLEGARGSVRGKLVEPRTKRVAFLRTVVGELFPASVTVVRARSDTLLDRSVDVALARATLAPPEWLREGARLGRSAVWVLLASDAPPSLQGLRIDVSVDYIWPATGVSRRAVRYVHG